jgi:hypothetical protein
LGDLTIKKGLLNLNCVRRYHCCFTILPPDVEHSLKITEHRDTKYSDVCCVVRKLHATENGLYF